MAEPRRGQSGRFLRSEYGGETGQGQFDLDFTGREAGGFEDRQETSLSYSFPASSRCAAAMYHFADRKLFMTWTNNKTPWIYHDIPFSVYDGLLNAPSAGKYVNQVLNLFGHNRVYPGDEYSSYIYGEMPNA